MTEPFVLSLVAAALLSVCLASVRLLRGPSQADRIVALDVVFSSSIALTAAAAVIHDTPLYLDVGLGLSIVGFVATTLWARLIDKSREDPDAEGSSALEEPRA